MNDLNICKTCIWFDDAACWNNQRICVDNREYFMQVRVSGDIVRSLCKRCSGHKCLTCKSGNHFENAESGE